MWIHGCVNPTWLQFKQLNCVKTPNTLLQPQEDCVECFCWLCNIFEGKGCCGCIRMAWHGGNSEEEEEEGVGVCSVNV